MIRYLSVISFFLACTLGFTQSESSHNTCSLLWSISGNGLSDTSYLFGTMHSSDSRLQRFDNVWQHAFDACSVIAGETDLRGGSAEDMNSLLQSMVSDTTLEMVLSSEKVDAIRNYLSERLGSEMAHVLMNMQPFLLMVLMMELPDDMSSMGDVMDIHLQDLAATKGMKVVGLETASEQLEVVNGVPYKYQAELLYEFVQMSSGGAQSDVMQFIDSEMVDIYMRQCLEEFVGLSNAIEMSDQLMNQLLTMRNIKFAERLAVMMKKEPVFCAVGALHLPADNGMIALLRSRGYVVAPVFFTFLQE